MKKPFKILFFLSFLTSIILNIVLIKNNIDLVQYNELPFGSSLAIMVYDDDTDRYVKRDAIPKGMYILNEEKTGCSSGGTITDYDSRLGTVKYNLNTSDECYLYLDTTSYFSVYIKNLYTSDGENDIYYHDGNGTYTNANLEAGDNSYRYSGANPNNYVCLGNDCTNNDNLYRIIGVFDDEVKLIKADYAGSNLLGTNGDYNSVISTSSYANYLKRGKLSTVGRYYWNYVNRSSSYNAVKK